MMAPEQRFLGGVQAEDENVNCGEPGAAQFSLNGTGLIYNNYISVQDSLVTELLLSANAKIKALNIASLQVNDKTLFGNSGSKMPLKISNIASKKRFKWEG